MRRRRRKRWIFKSTIFLLFLVGSFLSVLLIASFLLGPPSLNRAQNTIYYSTNEEVIGEEFGSEKRYWAELDNIDDRLEKAIILTEDQHFYEHFGFDFKRLAGAIWKDIKTLSLKEGASTITQQYARNLYLTHEKTWERKLYEAFYAIRLEMFYDKDELLEGYLNTIYYGHGAYGIEAASKFFFGKSADELSWAEAAMLAGIPKGPSIYSPFHNLEMATERQQLILTNLYDNGVIDHNTYEAALAEELDFSDQRTIAVKGIAPYFQDIVLNDLQELLDIDLEEIRSGGYQVYTTLDLEQQQALQQARDQNMNNKEIEVGAMAMKPDDGAITALIGGQDYERSSFNRVTQAQRMPGSAFKPFLYYAALENGMTAASTLMSQPTTFKLDNGNTYQPSNYNDYYADRPITMAQALALSDNIFAVKTNLYVTPTRLVRLLKSAFQFQSEIEPVASLALGSEVVTMKEMVTGYALIANGGKKIEPYTIKRVTDAHGNTLYDRESEQEEKSWSFFPSEEEEQVLNRNYTYILSEMMKGMFKEELNGYMQVTGASIASDLSYDYAGKSGTTDSDNWMMGFSPGLVAGVWVGYDDNREIVATEDKQYAKEVWAAFMEDAHADLPLEKAVKPDDVVEVMIDLQTGYLASDDCQNAYPMLFVKGTQPKQYCTLHIENETDTEEPEENGLLGDWWDWLWIGEGTEQRDSE